MRYIAVLLLSAAFAAAASAQTVGLKTGFSECTVDLDGARVISFRVNGSEMLWNGVTLQRSAEDWVHGGIPLCWPRFGIGPDGSVHGHAWRRKFRLLGKFESDARSEMTLGLEDGGIGLVYRVVLAGAMTLEMTAINRGTEDYRCSFGLHPYFLIGERDSCSLAGVDALPFEDDPSVAGRESGLWRGPVLLKKSIDRIFSLSATRRETFVLQDPVRKIPVTVECTGATHLNIWNPGPEKRCPGVVPGDEWRRFVCVEPVVFGARPGDMTVIPPGGRRTLKMAVRAGGRTR